MLSQNKKIEVQQQLEKFRNDIYISWLQSLDQADNSGSISDDMKQEGNWLLAKAIVDSFCRTRPYSPLSASTKKEFDNLYHFI